MVLKRKPDSHEIFVDAKKINIQSKAKNKAELIQENNEIKVFNSTLMIENENI